MLRLLLLLLILANGLWWGWTQGWLPAGLMPWPRDDLQREPGRLAQQVHPERVQVLPAGTARPEARSCWQAGPFTEADASAAEGALAGAGLPSVAWQRVAGPDGEWLRVPAADAAQQALLASMGQDGSTLPAAVDGAAGFRPCD